MFKEYNQAQNYLLPPSFKEFLWEWHESIILNELIEELNLEKLFQEYNKNINWNGRPAYNPKMLLKILIYGYMNNTFSSRKIAKKLKSDLWFMYLSWNNKPDFRTINRFRKEKWNILEDIFTQVVLKAKELWLISFWTLSLDWTKIYSNASKNKSYTLDLLDKKIQWFFDEADRIDALEDEKYWEENEDSIPEELKTKDWREKKKKELKEKREELEFKKKIVKQEIQNKKQNWINQSRINLTDKDSRLMKMKRKDWWVWYSPQNVTENQFVLVTTVPNNPDDSNELIPLMKKFQKKYKTNPKKVLADKGYWNEENYNYLEENNIQSYIPHPINNWKSLEDYIYKKENDTYEDKDWNIYIFKQFMWAKLKRKRWRPKKNEILKEEDFTAKLYFTKLKNGKNKFLYVNNWLKEVYKKNDERLYSEKWKKIYKKRSWDVENVFGNIKYNLSFERFLLRWFQWVQIEWNLINLAHNFKKLINFKLS